MSLTVVVVREYDVGRDKVAVEELEKQCEEAMGKQVKKNKPSVLTDMGDPISRVRNFSSHVMLVIHSFIHACMHVPIYIYIFRNLFLCIITQIAEYGEKGEIVGVIRSGIKFVTRPSYNNESSAYVKLACILGLRVSAYHRYVYFFLITYIGKKKKVTGYMHALYVCMHVYIYYNNKPKM